MLLILLAITTGVYASNWPIWRDSTFLRVGNSFGNYQCFYEPHCSPYFHPGIDIMAPPGTPVYAVKSGYVKAVFTIFGQFHWRVLIGDSSGTQECEALMYAHLEPSSIAVAVGDYVNQGQYLGDIVLYYNDFHHLHFAKLLHFGDSSSWMDWTEWSFPGNPMAEMDSIYDPDAPMFEYAYYNQPFAFAANNTANYFDTGSVLSGDVDIICRLYDFMYDYDNKVAPFHVEYKIEGDSVIPWTNAVLFDGLIIYDHNTHVIYQNDSICNSWGDFDGQIYYLNVTNSDGDSVIEAGDANSSWKTSYFHNGYYTVYVRAGDYNGNSTTESMGVTIENYFWIHGYISLQNAVTYEGTVVTISSPELSDTTDDEGYFYIYDVPGGSQNMTIYHPYYETFDTTIMMCQNYNVEYTLLYPPVCGDIDNNFSINILDVTYLINYLYKDGTPPQYMNTADVNNSGSVNLLDITYLISYLYKNGPEPMCP